MSVSLSFTALQPSKERKRRSAVFWATPPSSSMACITQSIPSTLWHPAFLRFLTAISPQDPGLLQHLGLLQSGCVCIYYKSPENEFSRTVLSCLKWYRCVLLQDPPCITKDFKTRNREMTGGYRASSVLLNYDYGYIMRGLVFRGNFCVFGWKNSLQWSSNKFYLRHLFPSSQKGSHNPCRPCHF